MLASEWEKVPFQESVRLFGHIPDLAKLESLRFEVYQSLLRIFGNRSTIGLILG